MLYARRADISLDFNSVKEILILHHSVHIV